MSKTTLATMTIANCGLKFFFEQTLQKEWTTFNIVRPAPEKKLPSSSVSPKEVLYLVWFKFKEDTTMVVT